MPYSRGERLFSWFNGLLLAVLSFLFVFPFWRIIVLSLNSGVDASRGGVYFWPRHFTWDNYAIIFSRSDILNAYQVTISRTLLGTAIAIALISLMAYGLSKERLQGRKTINLMIVFTMFFNGGLIPTYLLYRSLDLLNTFWVYVIPSLYTAVGVFIFRSFFRMLPQELEESAQIDGASDWTVYSRIVVPLSLPIFATMSLFAAVGHWNDYLTGVLYVTDNRLIPLQTLLMRIINENDSSKLIAGSSLNAAVSGALRATPNSIKMATLVAAVLPILCVYPFLQRFFVKGIIVGSLKG